MKIKKQGDSTMYLSAWPKSRILTIPNAGEDVVQWELLTIAGGGATRSSHVGDSLAVCF